MLKRIYIIRIAVEGDKGNNLRLSAKVYGERTHKK